MGKNDRIRSLALCVVGREMGEERKRKCLKLCELKSSSIINRDEEAIE